MLDEVVDADDVGVLDLRQELALGQRRLLRVGVPGVEHALQHDPPAREVVVGRQVEPAEAAVGQAPDHLVLARRRARYPPASG
jgi:hypothetical protein